MVAMGSDAFLSGQGIPVELSKIEGALTDLWGPAAEREGGPDLEHPSVTRVTLANLVIVNLAAETSCTPDILDTVVARHPCRAIVVRKDESLGRKVAAEISAVCHLPAPGMPQVCSERIVLRTGREGTDLIPGAIRPLLEADLPLVLWWVGDPRPDLAVFRDLADEANRLVLDLPDPGADPAAVAVALDPSANPYGRDLSWFGATPWRELVAQFFDPIGQEAVLRDIRKLDLVVEAAEANGLPRVAAWLAAWLAGQLGWTADGSVESSGPRYEATFRGANGPIAISIRSEVREDAAPARLAKVALVVASDGGETTYRLTRSAEGIAVETEGVGAPRLPRMVEVREFAIPDRVSAALESARDDPPYRKALPAMMKLIGASPGA